jgi:hypothetical protein
MLTIDYSIFENTIIRNTHCVISVAAQQEYWLLGLTDLYKNIICVYASRRLFVSQPVLNDT